MVTNKFAYLGTAVTYPISVTNGTIAISSGLTVIENSIIMILMTPLGTRYFQPDFGSNLLENYFEPNDEILATLLRTDTLDALQKWEKRATFLDVNVIVSLDVALLFITYRVLSSNEVNTFVMPFYRGKYPF